MSEEWLGQLIEGAYDAAVEGGWYEWLDKLRRSLASEGALMAQLSSHADAYHMMPIACGQEHYSHDELEFYLRHRGTDPFFRALTRQPNTVLLLDDALRARRLESGLGIFFHRLHERYRHNAAFLAESDQAPLLLGLFRDCRQSDFEPRQIQALEHISRHLSQAMALVPFIQERVGQRLGGENVMRHVGPEAVVRANGTLVYLNDAMEHYLERMDKPIEYDKGRLVARQPIVQRLLERALNQACQHDTLVRKQSHLPLGEERLAILPLPESVYPNATLWQIG